MITTSFRILHSLNPIFNNQTNYKTITTRLIYLTRSKSTQNRKNKWLGVSASNFKYTLDNKLLTLEQRDFYEKNGYILIPKLVEDDILDECHRHFVDLCEGKADRLQMIMMKDISLKDTGVTGEFLYNKVQDIVHDEVFAKYITHKKLLDYVECFTGPRITAVHSMLINKPPDSGKETSQHPLHQDLYYFPFRPIDRIVAAWTAMEPVTVDNGCLFVLPGSHKGQLEQHDYPESQVNAFYHGVRGYDHFPRVNLTMQKGDTAFFHPLLIHGSGVNITKGFRKAISCHYSTSDMTYIDVEGTVQERIATEIKDLLKRRSLDITYQDMWKLRALNVRG